MPKKEKSRKPEPPKKWEWILFKKSMLHYRDSIADTYHELRRESDLFHELMLYIPFVCAIIFFYYTNRIAFYYHNFGNYGLEENFIASTVPLIRDLMSFNFSRLSMGLDGPLYPVIIAIKNILLPDKDILKSALFLNVIFGSASLLISYYLIKKVFNLKTAVISLILIATNTAYFEFTYTAGSAAAFFFFTVFSLFFFFRVQKNDSTRNLLILFICGIAAGLSALTNLLGLLLLIFAPTSIIIFNITGPDKNVRTKAIFSFLTGFIIIFVPAVLFIKFKSAVFFTPLPLLEKTHGSLLLVHLKNLYFRLFADIGELIGWTIGAFVTLGILVMVLSENTQPQLAYMFFGILLFVGLGFLQHNKFYAFILLLFFIPLSANIFGSGVYKRILDKRVALGLLLIFIALLCVNVFRNLNNIGDMATGEPKHLLAIARYFREHPESRGPIISQRSLLPKRLGMEYITLDAKIDNMAALMNYAKEKKAAFLLADFPEYNTYPYLRYLSLPQMKNPFGLNEVVRKDYSALYKFDFTGIENISHSLYSAVQLQPFLRNNAAPLLKDAPVDSIAQFIKSGFRKDDMSRLNKPAFQIVSQYNMRGYELYGLIIRGIFNEISTSNLYAPENVLKQNVLNKNPRPCVLILPGEEKDGKGSVIARNYAENLVRAGFFVMVMDAPGTGERIGPFASLSAFMLYQSASGYSPAELFITETILAINMFKNIPQALSDSIHLLAIGDDTYTALYTALIDSSIKSLTFVGGPFPFEDMAHQNYRPTKSLVNGIAGSFGFKSLLKAVKKQVGNVQCVSTNVMQNPILDSYNMEAHLNVLPYNETEDFVKGNFTKSIEAICSFEKSQDIIFPVIQFHGFNDQEKAMSFTIGEQAVIQNSQSLIEVFERPQENDSTNFDMTKLDEHVLITNIKNIPPNNGMLKKKITGMDKKGMPINWLEIKGKTSRQDKILIILASFDSSLVDTMILEQAIKSGYTLCRLSFLPEVSGYPDAIKYYFDNLLFGISLKDKMFSEVNLISNFYHTSPELMSCDSLTGLVGLYLASHSNKIVKRLIVNNFTGGSPEGFYRDFYEGYDGNPLASGEYVNLNNLIVSLIIKDFGVESGDKFLEKISKNNNPCTLYYSDKQNMPEENAFGNNILMETEIGKLF